MAKNLADPFNIYELEGFRAQIKVNLAEDLTRSAQGWSLFCR